MALYEAVQAMKRGECEAAVVGGANLCLRPGTTLQFYKLNMLSDDGTCKSFDAAGKFIGLLLFLVHYIDTLCSVILLSLILAS